MSARRFGYRARHSMLALAVSATIGAAICRADTTENWIGANGDWSNAANWSMGIVPANGTDSANYSVDVASGSPTVDASFEIDSLDVLSSASSVDLLGGNDLTLESNSTNDGQIIVNSNGTTLATALTLNGGLILSGSGSVVLQGGGVDAAFINGAFTQASTHTITGSGQINADLTNDGTVNANVTGSLLLVQEVTNNGLLEATGGGELEIADTLPQGTAGTILAATGSTVEVSDGTLITGGMITVASGGNLIFDHGTTNSVSLLNNVGGTLVFSAGESVIPSLTNDGLATVDAGATARFTGNVADNGAMVMKSAGTTDAVIVFNGGTLSGSGNLHMGNTQGIVNKTANELDGTLTQAAAHTISGAGAIMADLSNDGIVDASVGQTLTLEYGSDINNGTLESTLGTLQIGDSIALRGTLTTVTQSTAGVISANGGNVNIGFADIAGGTLSSTGASTITIQNNASFTNVAISSGSQVTVNGVLNPSLLQNNGALTVSSDGEIINGVFSGTGTLAITEAGQVQGVPGGGIDNMSSLSIGPSAHLNLMQDTLYINYGSGPDPVSQIAAYLASGYNNGQWNGADGINNSTISQDEIFYSPPFYSEGYADGADGITGLPSGQIDVCQTLAGDATLSGTVGFGDFQLLQEYFGQPGAWDQGNFTYGSVIDLQDFQLLLSNYGLYASPPTPGELAAMNGFAAQFGDQVAANSNGDGYTLTPLPEPASTGMLGAAAMALLLRTRKHATRTNHPV
jgi:hypothetical protein